MTSWTTHRLADLTTKVGSGATPRGGAKSYKDSGIPLIRSQNVHFGGLVRDGLAFIDDEQASKLDNVIVEEADVLLNITGASIGRVCTAPPEMDGARVNQHVCIIRPVREKLLPEFLELFLSSPRIQRFIDNTESGATRQALTKGKILDFEVPVPPVSVQQKIVATFADRRARIERANRALDSIPNLIEKFRQSVLAAAFRGDLTKEWREQNPDVEPASVLLERIRTERRDRWIEDAAENGRAKAEAKARKAGKPWTDEDNVRALAKERAKAGKKCKEPEPVDPTGLPELPETWCWAWLQDCGEMSRGKSKHRPRNDPRLFGSKYPFIQTGEVARSNGRIESATKFYSEFGLAQSRLFPVGTVCITIAANIADTAILDIRACFPDSVVGVIPDTGLLLGELIEFYIRTVRNHLERVAPATAQKNINLSLLSDVVVPVPPHREQAMLARLIADALIRSDQSAELCGAAYDQLARLEQSILTAAFAVAKAST